MQDGCLVKETSPNRDKVGLASNLSVKVNFQMFESFLDAVVSLENGSKEVEVLLSGIDDAYSLKAFGRNAERDFAFDQTLKNDAFDVVGCLVRKQHFVIIERMTLFSFLKVNPCRASFQI